MQDVLSWRPLWFYSEFVLAACGNAVDDGTGVAPAACALFAWRHTVDDMPSSPAPRPTEQKVGNA